MENTALDAVLRESGLSHARLARRVNQLGAQQGIPLRYDKASVTRWIQGKRPRGRAPEFMAGALSEALRRTVTPAEIGLGGENTRPVTARALSYCEDVDDALRTLAELGSTDVSRRSLLGGVPFVAGALADPQRQWLLWLSEAEDGQPARLAAASDGGAAEPLHYMIQTFDSMDNRFGGAHVRSAIVHYLSNQAMPMVQQRGRREAEHRELFTAAAKLAAMAGWSSYDAGEYGMAQRYMTLGLRLCGEGGDRVLGGQIWAGISHLQTSLGYPSDGVYSARVGLATAKDSGSPLGLMRLHAMAARGYAARRDQQKAHAHLRFAEESLARSRGPAQESPWVGYLDHHYLEAETAQVFRDLGDGKRAEQMAAESVRHNAQRGRRQAIGRSVLATAHLQQGQLDAALESAHTALERLGSGNIHSERSVQALRAFRAELEPFRREEAVREFVRQARPVLGAA
ncbi:hypothetical protein GCM10027091_10720 [Streptomyces daliensis]